MTDKWNEWGTDKGHKLVEYACQCVNIPDDPAAPKTTEDCVGNYEYVPNASWKGAGACTSTFKGGGKMSLLRSPERSVSVMK